MDVRLSNKLEGRTEKKNVTLITLVPEMTLPFALAYSLIFSIKKYEELHF